MSSSMQEQDILMCFYLCSDETYSRSSVFHQQMVDKCGGMTMSYTLYNELMIQHTTRTQQSVYITPHNVLRILVTFHSIFQTQLPHIFSTALTAYTAPSTSSTPLHSTAHSTPTAPPQHVRTACHRLFSPVIIVLRPLERDPL